MRVQVPPVPMTSMQGRHVIGRETLIWIGCAIAGLYLAVAGCTPPEVYSGRGSLEIVISNGVQDSLGIELSITRVTEAHEIYAHVREDMVCNLDCYIDGVLHSSTRDVSLEYTVGDGELSPGVHRVDVVAIDGVVAGSSTGEIVTE